MREGVTLLQSWISVWIWGMAGVYVWPPSSRTFTPGIQNAAQSWSDISLPLVCEWHSIFSTTCSSFGRWISHRGEVFYVSFLPFPSHPTPTPDKSKCLSLPLTDAQVNLSFQASEFQTYLNSHFGIFFSKSQENILLLVVSLSQNSLGFWLSCLSLTVRKRQNTVMFILLGFRNVQRHQENKNRKGDKFKSLYLGRENYTLGLNQWNEGVLI